MPNEYFLKTFLSFFSIAGQIITFLFQGHNFSVYSELRAELTVLVHQCIWIKSGQIEKTLPDEKIWAVASSIALWPYIHVQAGKCSHGINTYVCVTTLGTTKTWGCCKSNFPAIYKYVNRYLHVWMCVCMYVVCINVYRSIDHESTLSIWYTLTLRSHILISIYIWASRYTYILTNKYGVLITPLRNKYRQSPIQYLKRWAAGAAVL